MTAFCSGIGLWPTVLRSGGSGRKEHRLSHQGVRHAEDLTRDHRQCAGSRDRGPRDPARRHGGVGWRPAPGRCAMRPVRDTRRLAEKQSALRRIATQVAAEVPPRTLFAQVTEEVGRLLNAPSARVVRYEEDGRTIVGGWTEDGDGLPVGSSVPVDGETVLARVRRGGRVKRIEGYQRIGGELAERLRARGYRASVAAPVRVAGRVWGALVASARDPRDLDEGAERRLCGRRRAGGPGAGQRRRFEQTRLLGHALPRSWARRRSSGRCSPAQSGIRFMAPARSGRGPHRSRCAPRPHPGRCR